MRITNYGEGIHRREIKGIEKLKSLPSDWYAYTNLDLALAPGKSREIDVILVTNDRVLLIDLKDWGGEIESREGRWFHNGRDCGPSPVQKIHANAKDVYALLKSQLEKNNKGKQVFTPKIQGLVVITADANLDGIAPTEIHSVLNIDQFLSQIVQVRSRVESFGGVHPHFIDNPLTGSEWKHPLSLFFNVSKGYFKPGQRNYGGYIAESGEEVFSHRSGVYSEYEAVNANTKTDLGIIRLWDFTKADTRFQNAEGRAEIAGRERKVISYLKDRSEECEQSVLQPKAEDPDRSIDYWEVYDRRRKLKRLFDFARVEGPDLSKTEKIEIARQIITKVSSLHLAETAHLDLGGHSIWIQQPSTVRLSHLMAARYPHIESLGTKRYQFLSSESLPENEFEDETNPQRKDVYLLGVVVHHTIFGHPPHGFEDGALAEWDAKVDPEGDFAELHQWFEKSLSWVPLDRFLDAGEALDAFNSAIASEPSNRDVIEGLDGFRTKYTSQLQLFQALMPQQTLRDDVHKLIWKSELEGKPILVKVWKRSCWGDDAKEGARILDFLMRARELQRSPLPSCPKINDVIWLGDSIVIVQEWVDGIDLARHTTENPSYWADRDIAFHFIKSLIELVELLHEAGFAHGDLKPQNIMLDNEEGLAPRFIDLIEFTSSSEGEMHSSTYSPLEGGRYERDRYAITKIAEELFAYCALDPSDAVPISKAINQCRTNPPINGTLLPLYETLEHLETDATEDENYSVRISLAQSDIGPVLSDEGLFYLRRAPDRESLFIRGACEEIEIGFNNKGEAYRGRRRPISQKQIFGLARHDFMSVRMNLEIIGSDYNDFTDLEEIIRGEEFQQKWNATGQTTLSDDDDETIEKIALEDQAKDEVVESIAEEKQSEFKVNVQDLWKNLIEVENDLSTEGSALAESTYRKQINRHVVEFELEQGSFDFNRDDRVLVERLDPKGIWRRIAYLDISKSKPDLVVLDTSQFNTFVRTQLVNESQRLRFTSHFEETSLQRRRSAITKILSRQSRTADLIDVFDPQAGKLPTVGKSGPDPDSLKSTYGLNDAQAIALSFLLGVRPVGLVQGPPGTGKTVFIAALIHYALTHGLAANVLLASQSHEAVNNAAESILKLFSNTDDKPSIIRVGNEGVVSDTLLPFHSAKVEQLYKDRFRASIKDRLRIGGRSLGIGEKAIEDIIFIETAVRPVVEKLAELETREDADLQRLESLRSTIRSQLSSIDIEILSVGSVEPDSILGLAFDIIQKRQPKNEQVSSDTLSRLCAIANLARDFIGSTSTSQRSFETFLAGTRQIVAGTCVGLGRSSLGLTATPFDLVIVDEAARCTASELSVPMQAGRWIVLVGDHAQLEPLHKDEVLLDVAQRTKIPKSELVRSDFERAFSTEYGSIAGRTLTTQYRMIPPIGSLVSSCFYDDMLTHGRENAELEVSSLPATLDKPIIWFDTDSLGSEAFQAQEGSGKSLTNPKEADTIVKLLAAWADNDQFREWVFSQTNYDHSIGVICTYADQRDLLRKKLRFANLPPQFKSSIKIDTVDSYQGKENPIVILSLVRNNSDGPKEAGAATISPGFMARANRINVAISRAKDRLVIVGAKRRWSTAGPLGKIVKAFNREADNQNARTVEVATFLITDTEKEKGRNGKPQAARGAV